MGKSAILAVRIVGDASDAIEAFDETASAAEKWQKGALAAGAAAGVALGAGFVDALNVEAGNDKLAGQLKLTEAEAARIGTVSAELFANGWGTGADQINEALHSVVGNISGMREASDADLMEVSQGVLTLANTFDQDLGQTTAAVSQLMSNGLAPNAQAALDIITTGLQGNARAGEDLIDTMIEYSPLMGRLGQSAESFTGMLNQGLEAGARNTDLVADALKEFQIRSTDASTASAAGYEALGLNAAEMTAQMAAGGEGAAAGLDTVLDRLRSMTDPVAQNAAAVALFGTQAEDLGSALYAIDPSSATAALGDVAGAASELGDTVSDNAASKIETFMRLVQTSFQDVAANAIPLVEPLLAILSEFAPLLGPLAVVVLAVAAAITVYTTAMKVYAAVQAIQTAAQWASNAAWLASPITWIVLAVVVAVGLLIAAIVIVVQNWDVIAAKGAEVWQGIMDWIGAAAAWLGQKWTEATDLFWSVMEATGALVYAIFEAMVLAPLFRIFQFFTVDIPRAIDGVKRWFSDFGNQASAAFATLIGWIRQAYTWLQSLISSAMPGWMKDLVGMTFSADLDVTPRMASPLALQENMPRMLTFDAVPSAMFAGNPLVDALTGRLGGGAAASLAQQITNVYNITVNGALDANAVAQKIREMLTDQGRASGRLRTNGQAI